jgi:hypothetical protein
MAKLQEDVVLIKISRLLADGEEGSDIIDSDVMEQLESLFTELAGPKSLVEIEKLDSYK